MSRFCERGGAKSPPPAAKWGNECGMAAGVVPRSGSEPPHTPVEVAAFLAEIDREAVDDRNFVLTGA